MTWGTNPGQVIGIDQPVPNPAEMTDPVTRASAEKALNYIGLDANADLKEIPVDQAVSYTHLDVYKRQALPRLCYPLIESILIDD